MLRKILLIASLIYCGVGFAQDRPGDHPFQVSVPLAKSEGFWKAVDANNYVFIFKFTMTGRRQLLIEQFDVQTCQLFARGPGREKYPKIKDKDGKVKTVRVIQALISSVDGSNFSYMAVLKAYAKDETVKLSKGSSAKDGARNINEDSAVLKISIFPELDSDKYTELKLEKVNSLAELSCNSR